MRANRTHDNSTKADALICSDPQRVVSVRIADCCPILLATADGKNVAAIHAGWRGTVAGVLTLTLNVLLAQTGHDASQIIAAIGPCIGREAFEVGPEVLAEFKRAFGDDTLLEERAGGKGRVDIRGALRLQLLNAGVTEEHIDSSDLCTVDIRIRIITDRTMILDTSYDTIGNRKYFLIDRLLNNWNAGLVAIF